MAKEFWDSCKVISDVPKNDKGDVVRVAQVTKNGNKYVDVRTFYVCKTTGELLPGKGITIPDDLVDEIATKMMEV